MAETENTSDLVDLGSNSTLFGLQSSQHSIQIFETFEHAKAETQ